MKKLKSKPDLDKLQAINIPKQVKHLVSIISTKGKSPEDLAKEVFQSHQKYHKVKQQVLKQNKIETQKLNHEQENSSETKTPDQKRQEFINELSKSGIKVEVDNRPGLVTQITDYPQKRK